MSDNHLLRLDSGEWVFSDALSVEAFNEHFKTKLPTSHKTVVEGLLEVLPSQKDMYRKWVRIWGFQFHFQRTNQLGKITVKVRQDLATLKGGVKSTYRDARRQFQQVGIGILTDYNQIIDRQAEAFAESLATFDEHETSYDSDLENDDVLNDSMEVMSDFVYGVAGEKDGPVASDRIKKKRGNEDVLKEYQQPTYNDASMTFGNKSGPKPGI